MPVTTKTNTLPEPLSRKRLKIDIEEIADDVQAAISGSEWEKVAELMSRGGALARGLVTMPAQIRVLRTLPKDPRYSQSLEHGLRILALFGDDESIVLGIADMADGVGMSRSTVHRYVISLVGLGQLVQGSGRKYRLATAPPCARGDSNRSVKAANG